MSADVCAVLGTEPIENLTAVIEKHGSDGSGCTILDCLVARDVLSGNRAVCILCLMHPPVHHRNVLARLGVPRPDTQTSLHFLDALSLLGYPSGCSYSDLLTKVTETVAAAQASGTPHVTLVVDDISALLDAGWDLQQIIMFLNNLRALRLASVAVLSHASGADIQTSVLAASIIHASDTAVTVMPLNTGQSAEVSGTMTIQHPQQPNNKLQSFHFRLLDRQVKVFPPGTIN